MTLRSFNDMTIKAGTFVKLLRQLEFDRSSIIARRKARRGHQSRSESTECSPLVLRWEGLRVRPRP
jgi:hypothetical protein